VFVAELAIFVEEPPVGAGRVICRLGEQAAHRGLVLLRVLKSTGKEMSSSAFEAPDLKRIWGWMSIWGTFDITMAKNDFKSVADGALEAFRVLNEISVLFWTKGRKKTSSGD
jgi:hypothetical protein